MGTGRAAAVPDVAALWTLQGVAAQRVRVADMKTRIGWVVPDAPACGTYETAPGVPCVAAGRKLLSLQELA